MMILVTGCAGYIGSVLCRELLNEGYTVVGIDNFIYNNQSSVLGLIGHKNFMLHKIDVRHINKISPIIQHADVIIPLAAIVGAPACDKDQTTAYEVNMYSIQRILNSLSIHQRVIYPNTNSGYGIGGETYCTEESALKPISCYGVSKCGAEKLILERPNSVVLRLATVCGPSPRMRFDLLVNDFSAQLYYNKEITIYEPNFMRNYIHINDVANAFKWFIKNSKLRGVYNLGHPTANLSKLDLAKTICSCYNIPWENIKIGEGKDPDQRNYIVSNDKILDTGFVFENSIHKAISEVSTICSLYTDYEVKKMRNI